MRAVKYNTSYCVQVAGGGTWTPFAQVPTGTTGGGTIAVSANGTNIVWAPAGAVVSSSVDRGTSWNASAGIKAGLRPVSDRVNARKFYAYDGLTGTVLPAPTVALCLPPGQPARPPYRTTNCI